MLQLIIPALNEQSRLPGTIAQLRAHLARAAVNFGGVEVIVVDNGSTDDTAAVAAAASSPALPVRVIPCATRGKGAAVAAGVAATTADYVGFMDADCATRLDALDEAWRRLMLGADVAIGSRAVDGSVAPVRHSAAREHGAALYRSLTDRIVPGVADTQCGFKLMRGTVARSVCRDLRTVGFSFDVELLARARMMGAQIAEFPVHWQDVPGSTFDPIRHGFESFWSLAKIAWLVRRHPTRARVTVLPLHGSPTGCTDAFGAAAER